MAKGSETVGAEGEMTPLLEVGIAVSAVMLGVLMGRR